jgi:hypothetical protein
VTVSPSAPRQRALIVSSGKYHPRAVGGLFRRGLHKRWRRFFLFPLPLLSPRSARGEKEKKNPVRCFGRLNLNDPHTAVWGIRTKLDELANLWLQQKLERHLIVARSLR